MGWYFFFRGVFGTVPVFSVPVWMSYRSYRRVRYRYWRRTEVTEVPGTGIDAVPNLTKCPVPVWKSVPVPAVPVSISYRSYRNVRYRYWRRTEVTEVSGTGIDVVPSLPKCPVPVIPAVYTGGMPRYVPYRTHPWNNNTINSNSKIIPILITITIMIVTITINHTWYNLHLVICISNTIFCCVVYDFLLVVCLGWTVLISKRKSFFWGGGWGTISTSQSLSCYKPILTGQNNHRLVSDVNMKRSLYSRRGWCMRNLRKMRYIHTYHTPPLPRHDSYSPIGSLVGEN